jgi:hypothetical protein
LSSVARYLHNSDAYGRIDASLVCGVGAEGAAYPFVEARNGLQVGDLLCDERPQIAGCDAYSFDKISTPVDERDHVLEIVAAQEITLASASERLKLGRQ